MMLFILFVNTRNTENYTLSLIFLPLRLNDAHPSSMERCKEWCANGQSGFCNRKTLSTYFSYAKIEECGRLVLCTLSHVPRQKPVYLAINGLVCVVVKSGTHFWQWGVLEEI